MKGNVKHPAILHFLIKKQGSFFISQCTDIALLHRELQRRVAQATCLRMYIEGREVKEKRSKDV
jgi:hypothetical protein